MLLLLLLLRYKSIVAQLLAERTVAGGEGEVLMTVILQQLMFVYEGTGVLYGGAGRWCWLKYGLWIFCQRFWPHLADDALHRPYAASVIPEQHQGGRAITTTCKCFMYRVLHLYQICCT